LGARSTDGPLAQTIGARDPGPGAPGIDVPGTQNVATEHRHIRHDSRFSATIYQWLSAVSGIVFQSLTVEAIRRPRLKLPLRIFAWQKLDRTFSSDISKKRACSKFWPHVIRGPPFSRGPYARHTVLNG